MPPAPGGCAAAGRATARLTEGRYFGYRASRTFLFLGCPVQLLQYLVIQLCPGQAPALLNLLYPELLPYTRINSSTFPALTGRSRRPG